MGSPENLKVHDTHQISLEKAQETADVAARNIQIAQADTEDKLSKEGSEFTPFAIKKTEKFKDRETKAAEKARVKGEESVLVRKDDADGLADGFSQRHGNREYRIDPRLFSQLAEDLGVGIHEKLLPDELIAFVRRRMTVDGQSPDVAIVDKAFEFLVETTRTKLTNAEGIAKERFEGIYNKLEAAHIKHFEAHASEIEVARKIIGAVDAMVEQTGKTVKETLERYRDVVHNPPEIQTLRKYYEEKGFKAMVLEFKGLNSYLGGNFKRSNLEGPEIAQLASAARKMQAILGVFMESKDRMKTIESYLASQHIYDSDTPLVSKRKARSDEDEEEEARREKRNKEWKEAEEEN